MKALSIGILLAIAASGVRADEITVYPCDPKFAGPAGFCEDIWSKTKDSVWMVFDVELKKPAPESLETEAGKALLVQYNNRFWYPYRHVKDGDTTKFTSVPPAEKDLKWSYEGLMFRRYYAYTVAQESVVAKMTFRSKAGTALRPGAGRPYVRAFAPEAFTADGREVPSAGAARPAETPLLRRILE